jgi:phospholipase A1
MKNVFYSLVLGLLFCGTTNAGNEIPDLQSCVDMQGKVSVESELACYRQASSQTKKQKKLIPERASWLTQEWTPNNNPLTVYKQNYVLVYSHSTNPNDAPTSTNPQNQVLTPSPLDNRDLKFQLSMKHDLADFNRYGSLWFGYTQLSFWQLYDASNSRPFRENNYEPELIYSIRPNDLIAPFGLFPSIINFGLVHQSNGQSTPRSRSWNRIYAQTGTEHNYGNDRRLVVLLRLWQRIPEASVDDDNPDITNYLGRGDLELRYSQESHWEVSVIAKPRSLQIDLAAPWSAWKLLTMASPGAHNTNVHLQYFNGYGESLIDYNQQHETWGVGLSFPFD